MNMIGKNIALMSIFGLMFGLTACSNSNQQQTTQTTEAKPQTTNNTPSNGGLEPRIVAEKINSKLPDTAPTYKVLTTGSMPPFSFFNEKGELMGLDIDAMQAIGEAGGFKVVFYTHPWQGLFDKVANGEYDMSASGISYTDERAKSYALSNSYFFSPSAMMVKDNEKFANVKGISDIKDLSIGVMKDSKQMAQAKQLGAMSLENYNTAFLAFQGLVQDKIAVTLQDEPSLRYSAMQYPEHKVKIIPYEDNKEPSSQQIILMKKDNQTVANQVNKGIEIILNNGEMKKIESKWLGKS